jgi:hypothetical protein
MPGERRDVREPEPVAGQALLRDAVRHLATPGRLGGGDELRRARRAQARAVDPERLPVPSDRAPSDRYSPSPSSVAFTVATRAPWRTAARSAATVSALPSPLPRARGSTPTSYRPASPSATCTVAWPSPLAAARQVPGSAPGPTVTRPSSTDGSASRSNAIQCALHPHSNPRATSTAAISPMGSSPVVQHPMPLASSPRHSASIASASSPATTPGNGSDAPSPGADAIHVSRPCVRRPPPAASAAAVIQLV